MFSLICAWINGWVNKGEAGDLRRHRAHYDVTLAHSNCKWPGAERSTSISLVGIILSTFFGFTSLGPEHSYDRSASDGATLKNMGKYTSMILEELQCYINKTKPLWRHNGHDGVSNHQPYDCLLNRLFRRRSKEASKLRVTGLCAGNSMVTGEFPAQRASNAENVAIWSCKQRKTLCIVCISIWIYCWYMTVIANTIGSPSTRHHSDARVSGRCLFNVDSRAFAIWRTRHDCIFNQGSWTRLSAWYIPYWPPEEFHKIPQFGNNSLMDTTPKV